MGYSLVIPTTIFHADFNSLYQVMEYINMVDRLCVEEGSTGYPTLNLMGTWHDGQLELMVHFREHWSGLESGNLEKFLLICEFPTTVCRKIPTAVPSSPYPSHYPRYGWACIFTAILTLISGDGKWEFSSLVFVVGLNIMRYAPGVMGRW